MRFGFVTCVELGLRCMETIYRVGGKLHLVMTLPDDAARAKSGRIWPDTFCRDHGIPLVKIRHVNDAESISAIRDHDLDWLFVIGWSQIAGPDVLAAPRYGVIGMHPTLLPVGRGRAAIPWAILLGLPETGVTMFKLDEGVDTGPIIAQQRLPIGERETATTLYQRVGEAHCTLIEGSWPALLENRVVLREQDESQATEWPGRRPADGLIAPSLRVEQVDRLVRATTHPYPGAFWRTEDGRVLRIWSGSKAPPASAPSNAAPGTSALTPYVRLVLADGDYYAVDFDWEDDASSEPAEGASPP